MLDHRGLLKNCLGGMGLAPEREEEIFRELGDHLEDHAAALEARGIPQDAAAREALDSVSNWPELCHEIVLAETEEANMNYRTKVLWLPALGALILSSTLLALFQFSGLVPRFYWWSGVGIPFYLPWLIALPAIGAVAAFWSQRAGGKAVHRLLAALAPPIGMLGTFLIGPFIGLLIYLLIPLFSDGAGHRRIRPPLHAPPMIGVFLMLASWVLLPAVGLLLGAVPFLQNAKSHQSSVFSSQ
jgi:hypothetical protein